MDPLDRPVWNALASGWAHVAQGDERARRIDPAYNVFGAARDPDALDALAPLVPGGGELWLVEPEAWPAPPGCSVVRTATIVQMVHGGLSDLDDEAGLSLLADADAAEMRALAALTRPGPFAERTHRLGRFVGVREGGQLIAMAGERMALPGWREVSGVCTHPDARGRGLAARLIAAVVRAMAARGERAFLTSYADNHGAIALYERLGFTIRREMIVTVLSRSI